MPAGPTSAQLTCVGYIALTAASSKINPRTQRFVLPEFHFTLKIKIPNDKIGFSPNFEFKMPSKLKCLKFHLVSENWSKFAFEYQNEKTK